MKKWEWLHKGCERWMEDSLFVFGHVGGGGKLSMGSSAKKKRAMISQKKKNYHT